MPAFLFARAFSLRSAGFVLVYACPTQAHHVG